MEFRISQSSYDGTCSKTRAPPWGAVSRFSVAFSVSSRQGQKRMNLYTVRIILVPYSFGKVCKTLVILTASVLAASCSPIYSIGVRGTLGQPMSVDCVLNAAQTTEGVRQVLIHEGEPSQGGKLIQAVDNMIDPPTVYLVRAIDQDAQIEQRLLKNGQVIFWVGRHGVGVMPSLHTIEMDQAFHIRLASHIAEVCKARYSGNTGLTCVPDSEACQKLLANPGSK
jgi:hypothetical protein